MANKNLQAAKTAKKDEFYTQLSDIEKELRHYKEHFKDKTVICNCDDPRVSNFYVYFKLNFRHLGLKRLICTCYKHQDVDLFSDHTSEKAVYIDYRGEDETILPLKGDGDFRSKECVALLQEADIVVTNPPFSLFREYVAQLMKYEKKFLIIGNQNAITYKEIFPLFADNKIWLGYGFNRNCAHFINFSYEDTATDLDHKEGMIRIPGVMWFTNLDIPKRFENMILYKKYTEEDYPKYDNYDAINVNKTPEIPMEYYGTIGVPITYITKYNPKQFEILHCSAYSSTQHKGCGSLYVGGKKVYARILIRRKQQE